MYVELRQHLWMSTPMGEGRAIAVIDYGPEDDLLFVCIQQDAANRGEIRTWHNSEVRVLDNRSLLRSRDLDKER